MLQRARQAIEQRRGMKNPYAGMGLQGVQKPPTNLGVPSKPMFPEANKVPMNPVMAKPAIDPRESYFAENAQAMKPMTPDMYAMRRNKEADKYFQPTRK